MSSFKKSFLLKHHLFIKIYLSWLIYGKIFSGKMHRNMEHVVLGNNQL